MGETDASGKLKAQYQEGKLQKCFVAHSYKAEWHDTIEGVCNELLPEYGLHPWYAEYNCDLTPTLRDKVAAMIDNAHCGIYDLSYWRPNDHSPWIMPCNVLIELGIAIALNRPTILLRHTENRLAGIALPKSLQSVTQICEFAGGEYTLKEGLREHLSHQANLPTDYDWQHHRCRFGEINCSYIQVSPHTTLISHDKFRCHIADGPDTDQLDFRHTIEKVLENFNNISYSYLDKGSIPNGYTFLLCSHCQLIRTTPFAIYRITPDTSPDTYIAIGMSIGLEHRFHYKIPRFLITKDRQYMPSLLQGYQRVPAESLHTLKMRLQPFVQQVLTKIDEPAYWRPQDLPFEKYTPPNPNTIYEDTVSETSQEAKSDKDFSNAEIDKCPFCGAETRPGDNFCLNCGNRLLPPNPVITGEMPQEAEPEKKSISIFMCSAREDEKLLDELRKHLRPLQRQGLIDVWHDRDINAGVEWEKAISKHLNTAQIILLLISPDFMASDYAYLPLADIGEARVIPIILRSANWKKLFEKFNPLPSNGRAVTQWRHRDAAFLDIAEGIKKIIEELREK